MSLALDPATEQRIQRELARGPYRGPAELINRALDLLESQTESQENWLLRNKDAINERLEESMAQAERGEVYTPEEIRALLSQDRQSRANRSQSPATSSRISPQMIYARSSPISPKKPAKPLRSASKTNSSQSSHRSPTTLAKATAAPI
jgi:Arc/MetJ-type ribon-helix-helix transcriptional regulator